MTVGQNRRRRLLEYCIFKMCRTPEEWYSFPPTKRGRLQMEREFANHYNDGRGTFRCAAIYAEFCSQPRKLKRVRS